MSPSLTSWPAAAPVRRQARPHLDRRIGHALEALRHGRAVVLLDDGDRENEADLVVAAEHVDEALMAMLIRECSGIVCLCLPAAALAGLGLPPMVARNESRHGTAFTVSIDARHGVTTGVSAADRVATVRAAVAPDAKSEDLVSPGHVFPLRAAPGGVLERRGHTEGAVDLVRLAGFAPAAVLCELMHVDGTMMRGEAALAFADAHGFAPLTIAELVDYRRATESADATA